MLHAAAKQSRGIWIFFLTSSLTTLSPAPHWTSLSLRYTKLAPWLESLSVLSPLPGTHFSPVIHVADLFLIIPHSSLCSNVTFLVIFFPEHLKVASLDQSLSSVLVFQWYSPLLQNLPWLFGKLAMIPLYCTCFFYNTSSWVTIVCKVSSDAALAVALATVTCSLPSIAQGIVTGLAWF